MNNSIDLNPVIGDITNWLSEGKFFKYKSEDFIEDYGSSIRAHLYTDINHFIITANKDYIGCYVEPRKSRAGETWVRSNKLAEGSFCRSTWDKILADMISCELVDIKCSVKESKKEEPVLDFYSPNKSSMLSWQIPTDRKKCYMWNRYFAHHNPLINTAIRQISSAVLSFFKDESNKKTIKEIENIARELSVIGDCFIFKSNKTNQISILNPDDCEIKIDPSTKANHIIYGELTDVDGIIIHLHIQQEPYKLYGKGIVNELYIPLVIKDMYESDETKRTNIPAEVYLNQLNIIQKVLENYDNINAYSKMIKTEIDRCFEELFG